MADEHWCTVCFTASVDHDERCGWGESDCFHFPPLCCPGCACGSFEEAHAPAGIASGEGEGRSDG